MAVWQILEKLRGQDLVDWRVAPLDDRPTPAERGLDIVAEVGINTGPVTGGLVGRRRFIYDLWGDTVRLARGIVSDGQTSIQVTAAVRERVRDLVAFGGPVLTEIKGMGRIELYPVSEDGPGRDGGG